MDHWILGIVTFVAAYCIGRPTPPGQRPDYRQLRPEQADLFQAGLSEAPQGGASLSVQRHPLLGCLKASNG